MRPLLPDALIGARRACKCCLFVVLASARGVPVPFAWAGGRPRWAGACRSIWESERGLCEQVNRSGGVVARPASFIDTTGRSVRHVMGAGGKRQAKPSIKIASASLILCVRIIPNTLAARRR